jgi:hypothetical protein
MFVSQLTDLRTLGVAAIASRCAYIKELGATSVSRQPLFPGLVDRDPRIAVKRVQQV